MMLFRSIYWSQGGGNSSGGGGGGGITTIDGNTGSVTGATVTISRSANYGNFSFDGSGTTLAFTTGDATGHNTFAGPFGGNTTLSGTDNTALGWNNSFALTSGSGNCSFGAGSMPGNASGSNNTSIGFQSLNSLGNGSANTCVGYNAGTSYTGTESSNILIRNTGSNGESNVIRIGTSGSGAGQQNAAYIAGIYGNSPSSPQMCIINSSGQLGSQAIPGGASLSPYIVGATNSDYTTIQAAITAANGAGASASAPLNIYIKPGTYNENLTIYDGINLIGMDESVFYGKQGSSITSKGSVKITGTIDIASSSTYNKFQNIAVYQSATYYTISWLNTTTTNNTEFENCYVECTNASPLAMYIANPTAANVAINNCFIKGDVYSGGGTCNVYITNSTCTATGASTNQGIRTDATMNCYSSNCNYFSTAFSCSTSGQTLTLYSYSDYIGAVAFTVAGAFIVANFYGSYINGGYTTFLNGKTGVTINLFACTDGTTWQATGPTSTSATIGVNGAVPALAQGYLTVNISGTDYKIPYFNI